MEIYILEARRGEIFLEMSKQERRSPKKSRWEIYIVKAQRGEMFLQRRRGGCKGERGVAKRREDVQSGEMLLQRGERFLTEMGQE